MNKSLAVRRDGVAGADLCYVACGCYDGFWELYLKPWDIAAGSLILTEAGGKVSSFDESAFDVYGPEILATNGRIHQSMRDVLTKGVQWIHLKKLSSPKPKPHPSQMGTPHRLPQMQHHRGVSF